MRRHFLPIGSPLRREIESDDVVQDAWSRAFDAVRKGKKFAAEEDFPRFQRSVARNCCRDYYRSRTTAKRALDREEPLELHKWYLLAAGSSPYDAAALSDRLDRFLEWLAPSDRLFVELRHMGATRDEIATALGVTPRTVARTLQKLLRVWQHLEDPGGGC